MAVAKRMDGPAWVMLLALSAIWGGSFVFTEIALSGLPVLTIVALRVSIGTATLWLVVAALRQRVPRSATVWAAFAVMGLFNNAVPFTLIVWGQTATTAGLAAVLNATTPLFTGIVAGVFLADERLDAGKAVGLIFGLAGVVVIVGPEALGLVGADIGAEFAILGAAFSYAVSSVFARRFKRLGVAPVMIAAGQTLASTLVLAPLALIVDRPFALPAPGLGVWAAVLAIAVVGTGLAYILYFAILARSGATNVVLVTVLVPVFAVVVGAAFLAEPFSGRELGGMVLIALGLSVIDGRLWRRSAAGAAPGALPPAPRG